MQQVRHKSHTFLASNSKQRSSKRLAFCKYSLSFALFLLFSVAKVAGGISPFGFGAYIALVFCGANILILSPLYLVAYVLANPSLNGAISALSVTLTLMAAYGIHKKAKKPLKSWLLTLYALVGQAAYIYFCIALKSDVIISLVSLVLGIMFMYVCAVCFNAAKRLKYKLNKSELACTMCVLVAAANGLAALDFFVVSAVLAIGALCVLVCAYSLGASYAFGAGAAFGLGIATYSGATEYIAGFALITLFCVLFCRFNKVLAALSCVLADLIFGYFFQPYEYYSLWQAASFAIGALAFCTLPVSILDLLHETIIGSNDKNSIRFLIDKEREDLSFRLKELSSVYQQMQNAFNQKLRKGMDVAKAREIVCGQICQKLCNDCKLSPSCLGEYREQTANALMELSGIAFSKGKLCFMDVPLNFTARCSRINAVISCTNQMVAEFNGAEEQANEEQANRIALGEHMGGISKMLSALSKDTKKSVSYDASREKMLIEELTYADIIASEALVLEDASGVYKAFCVLQNRAFDQNLFESIVRRVLRCDLRISDIQEFGKAGWFIVSMVRAPRYDCVFGCASVGKNNAQDCGDTHAFLRIAEDKFMVALSDGMGSGAQAQKLSATTIALVEGFYKAGFESELIINEVNKFVSQTVEEGFAAIDLGIISLNDGQCDLIKIGAPYGAIKRKSESEILSGGALPLGALPKVAPHTCKRRLLNGDTLIFCSDGVTDLLSENRLQGLLNNTKTHNPQTLAESILTECYELDQSLPHDDMTVVCVRMFECV